MGNYLKEVEEQLAELTERGAHRRPRPRLDLIALGAAVAVVAVVAVAVSTIGRSAHPHASASHFASANPAAKRHSTVRRPAAGPTTTTGVGISYAVPPGGPVPAGFGPESFTAIDELDWWLLGSAPCSRPPCTSIVRTTNGGRTFVGIPAPRTPHVSQLRFAGALNGYAYGPELWFTPDGGFNWHPVQISGGEVTELAIGGGYVYAILRGQNGSGTLVRAAIGSQVWKTLPQAGDAFSGLWVHGSSVLLETQSSAAQNLMVSTDHGDHFAKAAVPPSVACQLEMPAPPVIWEHCATGMLSATWRSADEGRSIAAVNGPAQLPNSAAFGSASATTAVVGYRQLYQTTNGGASWSPVAGASGITWWQYIGFTDPTHGVAIGYVGSAAQPSNERLYYTTDGGASYHLVRIR